MIENWTPIKIERELKMTPKGAYYFLEKRGALLGSSAVISDREAVQYMIDKGLTGLIPNRLSDMVVRTYDKANPHLGYTYKLKD